MWSLLFASCRLFVAHGAAGAVYALPALALMFAGVKFLQMNAPPFLLAVLLVLFILANTLYMHAATLHMLKKPDNINFFAAMRWRKKHTDFLLFVSGGLMVLAALALYFADIFSFMTDKAKELSLSETAAVPAIAVPAINSVLLFGSRFAAILFLFVTLTLWGYLCRIGIRMPAHADGRYLRLEEALSLTRGGTLKIIALSLLFIVAVSAIADAVSALPALVLADAAQPSPVAAQRYELALPAAYFVVMQLHLAMWTAIYKATTVNYYMSRVVY